MAKQIEKLELVTGIIIIAAIITAAIALFRFDTTGKSGSGLPTEFDYDIEDLKQVDRELILYRELETAVKTGFAKAVGVTVSLSGQAFVVGDAALKSFSLASGDLLFEVALPAKPLAITVFGDYVYIAMQDRVGIYNAKSGEFKAGFELGNSKSVYSSIAVSGDDIFLADAGNRVVLRYDIKGKLFGRIGEKDPDRIIPGFSIPSPYFDLAIASDGLLRVVNPGMHRIEAYTFDGDLEFSWGVASAAVKGFCGCCNPCNFAIASNGNFITAEKGIIRIKEYDQDGKFVGVIASTDQLTKETDVTSAAFDVAVDNDGMVYVLDTINQTLRRFVRKQANQ